MYKNLVINNCKESTRLHIFNETFSKILKKWNTLLNVSKYDFLDFEKKQFCYVKKKTEICTILNISNY